MSFYKSRVNYGLSLFGDSPIGEVVKEDLTQNAGKHLLNTRLGRDPDELIDLTAKAWTIVRPARRDVERSSVWKAGLPGYVCYPWFNNYLYPKLTDRLFDIITVRRDYESPGSESKVDELSVDAEMWVGYRAVAAALRWFDIYDDEWLWEKWNATEYVGGISREDKLYDMLFVRLPYFITQEKPEMMDFFTGDYDELLRFLRALYSLAVLSGSAEDTFNKQMVEPLLESYEEVLGMEDLSDKYNLWHLPAAEDLYLDKNAEKFKLKLENKLLGRPKRNPAEIPGYEKKTRLGLNLLIDIAHLFKYIDVRTGSYFWLDKLAGLSFIDRPLTNFSRIKRRIKPMEPWKISFAVDGVWIDPVADLHILYDKKRRELKRILPPVGEVTYRALSETPTFEFVDIPQLKLDLETMAEQNAIERVIKKLGDLDPAYRAWFFESDDEEEMKITIYNNEEAEKGNEATAKGQISFISAVKSDLREYQALVAFLFYTMTTVQVPLAESLWKLEDGIFKAKVNPGVKEVLDIYLQERVGLGLTDSDNVGDYFMLCLATVFGEPVGTDFISLFYKYNEDDFLYVCKSILTVVACSPRISLYFMRQIDDSKPPMYTSRIKMVEEIEAERSVSKRYWKGEEVLREIKRSNPYNVFKSDDFFLRELLKVKLY